MVKPDIKNYFVDEAGDLTLFNKRKQIVVGNEGSSSCFMVGMADIPRPDNVKQKLDELRQELLNDPYFRGVPSMQPEQKKTAICFHAKDDLPEVRREVFKLLPSFEARIIIAVRRKLPMAFYYQHLFKTKGEKFSENKIYDELISQIFKGKLHKADEHFVTFARRGKSERSAALREALNKSKEKFEAKWGTQTDKPVTIMSALPSHVAGLQVVDYYLWALQRMYERGEDRFFNLLAAQYRLIMDLDDTRNKPYGEWYSDSNPCTLEKIMLATS